MNQHNAPLRARLHYLQLSSPDPERLARFYGSIFGMSVERCHDDWLCSGPHRQLAFSSGEPKALVAAGYSVSDPSALQALRSRVTGHAVEPTAFDAKLFATGPVAFLDPDGNRIVYGLPISSIEPAKSNAPLARLQHVVVGSTEVARMVAFYTNVVGLRRSDDVTDETGGLRTCFLRSDDEHHSFAIFQTPQNRFDHHCYELTDWNAIRDWADRLAAADIPLKWGPGRHGPGNNLFLFFHDPDGNWVELSAELEIVAPDRPTGVWRHEERTLNQWGRGLLRS